MQTFLPYPDFDETARCLDNSRLGNQCYREVLTLLNGGWTNHPASKMWTDYKYWLALYGLALAKEMGNRKKSNGLPKWRPEVVVRWTNYYSDRIKELPKVDKPIWLGSEDFHNSHKSNLLRKDYNYYSQFNWTVPDNLPYIWPV